MCSRPMTGVSSPTACSDRRAAGVSFVFSIEKKRYGEALDAAEIGAFVRGSVDGTIPPEQLAAMCMAICLQGMSERETVDLIQTMLDGGGRYDIAREVPDAVEQHTTGGVGDGIDLTLLPLLAAAGLHPTKLTAPAIGISSGIIDKVDSIPGMRTTLDRADFLRVVGEAGMALANHGPDLVPADARLYAIRDVTATIDSVALIAASILSKKLATGAPHIHVSVKYGLSGIVKERGAATELARLMASVATAMGRRITVPLIAFDGPLGRAFGTALEVRQAVDLTRGGGPPDLRDQVVSMGAQILHLTGREIDPAAGRAMLGAMLDSGRVFETLCRWVRAQGGDTAVLDEPDRLPCAPVRVTGSAPEDGTLLAIDGGLIGMLSIVLGGGRLRRDDPLDHRVGIVLHRQVGDPVSRGEPIFTIHAASGDAAEEARRRLTATCVIGAGQPMTTLVEDDVFGVGRAAFANPVGAVS